MARIPLVSSGSPDSPDSPGQGGRVVHNVMKALSNHPGAARAIGQLAAVGYMSENLSPIQRELAYLAASTVNRCHY